MSKIQVWIGRRKTGARKLCPGCRAKNRAAATVCSGCGANLRGIKRSYGGKGYSYVLRWVDLRTGREKSESVGTDKVFAQHMAAKRRQELLSGASVGITKIDFDSFVAEHLGHIANTLSLGSYKQHELVLRQFRDVCHPKEPASIDFQMLEQFRSARIEAGVSPATVNKSLRTLQGALERAAKRGYLVKNPFRGNRKSLFVPEAEPAPIALEPEEFRNLLAACPDSRWRGICAVGYFAGLRQGEILALEWSDLDFGSGVIHVRNKADHRTKSGKNRDVPMSAEVVSALRSLQHGRFKSQIVFVGDALSGRKMSNNVNRDFAAIVKRAGLVDGQGRPKFTMHDLRRTFVTDMLAVGTDPKSVQALAGHASVQTTLRHYAAVKAKALSEAVDRRSRAVSPAG